MSDTRCTTSKKGKISFAVAISSAYHSLLYSQLLILDSDVKRLSLGFQECCCASVL